MMRYGLAALAWGLVGGLALAGDAAARDLTFTSYGGAYQEAESKSYLQPFTAASGIKVVEDNFTGEMAKIRTQVETRAITWDIVNVAGSAATLGCEQGLFERLDWSKIIDKADLLPVAIHDCGVGINAGATIMTYDRDKFPGGGPKSWADMWDTARWPGTRGFRFDPKFTLEAALLADGVPGAEVYKVLRTPAGVDRAFAKLDRLKPQIRWWKSGAESVQLLASGEYAIASAFYGRVFNLNQSSKRNFEIVRSAGTFQDFSYYAILKGSPNLEAAYKLLAFASKPEIQAGYTKFYPYGPANRLAYAKVTPEDKANLLSPVGMDETTIFEDIAFWVDNLEDLQKRFSAWAAR